VLPDICNIVLSFLSIKGPHNQSTKRHFKSNYCDSNCSIQGFYSHWSTHIKYGRQSQLCLPNAWELGTNLIGFCMSSKHVWAAVVMLMNDQCE